MVKDAAISRNYFLSAVKKGSRTAVRADGQDLSVHGMYALDICGMLGLN